MTPRFRSSLRAAQKSGRAFTLVEVILSISVSALIMFACCALMFDMVKTLEFFERGWNLKAHADGVEKYLRGSFVASEIKNSQDLGTVQAQNSKGNIFIARLPEKESSADCYITFGVVKDRPLYLSPTGFSADKYCFLVPESDGLYLVWRFAKSEDKISDPAVYKTLISPYAKKVAYFYKDSARWQEESRLRTTLGDTLMPSYIKITFEYGDEKLERVLYMDNLLDPQLSK